MALSPNTRLGSSLLGYRLDEVLGRGGAGVVYRAFDTRLNRTVALKLVAPEIAADEAVRRRFLQETELVASLEHPNIVPIHDAGEIDGELYLVMRLVESDLRAVLQGEGRLEPARVVEWLGQVADALDAAHRAGVIHGDVKPSNVLVADGGHCYLADFGLSRQLADPFAASERPLAGTAAYMAPEQISGEPVSPATDGYALACVLQECLTGSPPFRASSEMAMLFAHVESEPMRASEQHPGLPSAVDDVLARGLAKESTERPATCRELIDGLASTLARSSARRRRRRVTAGVVASALVVLAAAVTTSLVLRDTGAAASATGVVVRIDPESDRVVDEIAVGAGASAVAATDGVVWVASKRGGTLWRVDPGVSIATAVTANGTPVDVALFGGRAYVAAYGPTDFTGNVTEYDARNGRRIESIKIVPCVYGVAAGTAGVWATPCPWIVRLSFAGEPEVVRTIDIPPPAVRDAEHDLETLNDVALDERYLWVLGDAADRRLWQLDARQARIVRTVELPFPPSHVAVGEGAVWVTDQLDDRVARIDPATGNVDTLVSVGRGASGVAVGAGSVWVTGSLDGTVSKIDPTTSRVASTIRIGGTPRDVAVAEGIVWVVGDAG